MDQVFDSAHQQNQIELDRQTDSFNQRLQMKQRREQEEAYEKHEAAHN